MKIVKSSDTKLSRNRQLIPGQAPTVVRTASLAQVIQRFYSLVDRALEDLEGKEEMGSKEINAIVGLAKTLPVLEQAELARNTKINHKNLKDLTNAELKRLAGSILEKADAMDSMSASSSEESVDSQEDADE